MVSSRKEIMLMTNKEKAFQEINMRTDWSNHRKAAERSSWRKKHEPEKIVRQPNRGKRYNKKPPPEDEYPPCYMCQKSSEGYDFPCGHPICHPCFQKLFVQYDGYITCRMCRKEYSFCNRLLE